MSMLIGDLKPGRQDQQPLPNRIRLPVLFPAAAPVFIGQFVPDRLSQSQMEGCSQGHKSEEQLRSLILRPFISRQPGQKSALIRCLGGMLNGDPVQPEIVELPEKRLLQFRLNRQRQAPPHHSVTGWAS